MSGLFGSSVSSGHGGEFSSVRGAQQQVETIETQANLGLPPLLLENESMAGEMHCSRAFSLHVVN